MRFFGVSYTTVQTIKLLYETSLYPLPFLAKIMHKAFVNMVLTEEDEMVVPLCLIDIALAMQHLNGPRIIQGAGQGGVSNEEIHMGLTMLW